LLPWKSALDNVLFPFSRPKGRRAADDRRAHGPPPCSTRSARRLPPSQAAPALRRHAPARRICRALVYEPDLLLMDEPFSALDAITRDEMNLVLMKMWEEHHRTALFVTHSIREAVYLADRVLVMSQRPGRIIEDIRIPSPAARAGDRRDGRVQRYLRPSPRQDPARAV